MLEALMITLREGVEAALVVGILMIYLRKIGRNDLSRWVYWGLFIALGGSVLGGIGFRFLEINEEAYEGVILLLSAVFVGTMVVWMARTAKGIRKEIERKVEWIVVNSQQSAVSKKGFQASGFSLLTFTFLMVFREGVETVLFLGALSYDTEGIYSFIGVMGGLSLAIAFGISFVKGSLRIDLRKFFPITTAILLVLVFQLIVNGFHELFEAGVLPSTQKEMAIVGPIVKNNLLFLMFILVLPFSLILISEKKVGAGFKPAPTSAELRKMNALRIKERRWRLLTSLATLGILLLLGYHFVYSKAPTELSSAEFLSPVGGEFRIPISQLEDGNLHRFGYETEGKFVRFLLMKIGVDQYGCALDACEICGDQGYYQDGKNVVCRNCVADIYIPTIGRKGGCNPIPLEWSREGGEIVIEVSELESAKTIFKGK